MQDTDNILKVPGWDLAYFQTGEWQVIEERLDEQDEKLVQYNPARADLFNGLRAVPFDQVRVCIMGQDPYPKRMHATGVAFSIPRRLTSEDFPPTLVNIFNEYQSDLHYPAPKTGDLTPWVKQGVLLWNVYPSCQTGKPASHHWNEWTYLTKEIVEKLDAKGNVVFVLLGAISRAYSSYITVCPCITTSHPSPLGVRSGFIGSRIFTGVNQSLCSLKQTPIDWRLP